MPCCCPLPDFAKIAVMVREAAEEVVVVDSEVVVVAEGKTFLLLENLVQEAFLGVPWV